jgi:hypothetical protein
MTGGLNGIKDFVGEGDAELHDDSATAKIATLHVARKRRVLG